MNGSSPLQTFSLFGDFPVEIQLEIFTHLGTNDLICLSLTSHAFHDYLTPRLPSKPSLLSVDQTRFVNGCAHGSGSDCYPDTAPATLRYDPSLHRRIEHAFESGQYGWCWKCRVYPSFHPKCQVYGCKKHCTCISCPLYIRLRKWFPVGDGRRFCPDCRKFTKRTKKNPRCLHGRPKKRKVPNNHWTARKGHGSWGYRWWRRWGTSSMDPYEPPAKRKFMESSLISASA